MNAKNVVAKQNWQITVKLQIIALAFIRIITFQTGGGGHLLKATVFDNSWKNFNIYKFSSDDRHVDIGNWNIY